MSLRKLPISDPMLQGKAIQFDKDFGNTQFKASKDWLEKFCKCNNVAFLCKKWWETDVGIAAVELSKIAKKIFQRL